MLQWLGRPVQSMKTKRGEGGGCGFVGSYVCVVLFGGVSGKVE